MFYYNRSAVIVVTTWARFQDIYALGDLNQLSLYDWTVIIKNITMVGTCVWTEFFFLSKFSKHRLLAFICIENENQRIYQLINRTLEPNESI